eukprot:9054039-Alexandrium_andersonii.AAC.1
MSPLTPAPKTEQQPGQQSAAVRPRRRSPAATTPRHETGGTQGVPWLRGTSGRCKVRNAR